MIHPFKQIVLLLGLFAMAFHSEARIQAEFAFAGSKVVLLDSAGAAAANILPDEYTNALTPFDLQIRLDKAAGGTEKDYLALAASQVRSWPVSEQQQLKEAFAAIDAWLQAHKAKLVLPPVIELIRTEGKEEFGAEGYTRGDRIMLHISPEQPVSVHLVAHELFHVYSRFNKIKRDAIYQVFGFLKCNRINTAAAVGGHIITNPDCPFTEHYIHVMRDDKPVDAALLLYSNNGYKQGGHLGDYVNIGLLALSGKGRDRKPLMEAGKGVIYDLETVPDLFRQISNNTGYILHPEEIAAEHFAMWVTDKKVTQPEFLERLQAILQQ